MEKAKPNDANDLTELTLRSKAHWNYGEAQIEAWREDLTISANYIRENQVYKLVREEKLLGFYAYDVTNNVEIQLNFLFIDPKYIGKGYGKKMMKFFLKSLDKSIYTKVRLDADPNATKFYEQLGFKIVGKKESTIKGRFLPIMEIEL